MDKEESFEIIIHEDGTIWAAPHGMKARDFKLLVWHISKFGRLIKDYYFGVVKAVTGIARLWGGLCG